MSTKVRAPRKAKVVNAIATEPPGEPAPVSAPVSVPAPVAPSLTVVEEPAKAEEPPKKEKKSRASKKTPPVVAIVTPSGITGSFLSEQRPLIAHLPVSTASLNFDASNLLKYDPVVPTIPKPYDNGNEEMSYLEGIPEGVGVESDIVFKKEKAVIVPSPTCKLPTHYSEKLMVLFQDCNRYQKLPEKTEIACFWCCHSFNSQPVAIPSHILDEIWYMYGNFCSPECCTAYLFKERIDNHAQWERYALLNSLYAEDAEVPAGSSRGIRPAPPREPGCALMPRRRPQQARLVALRRCPR